MIQGLSHMTFIVADLDAMGRVLVDVLGARRVYESGERTFSRSPEVFYELAGVWIAVMQGEPLPEKSYNHVAFKIDEADFDDYLKKIREAGLEFAPPRPRVEGEGRSIYFYDHDRHLFELHTGTLDQRLQRYRRDAPS